MKEWTGIEVERARQELEQAAAMVLGRMIFEFSRLDMALGLVLVWSNEGAHLEKITPLIEGLSFHKKVDRLKEHVQTKYLGGHEAGPVYANWIVDATAVRKQRNDLVHGRWGIDHMKNQVVNVIGLPTSLGQSSTGYSIDELKAVLERMVQLQVRLAELRERWPV